MASAGSRHGGLHASRVVEAGGTSGGAAGGAACPARTAARRAGSSQLARGRALPDAWWMRTKEGPSRARRSRSFCLVFPTAHEAAPILCTGRMPHGAIGRRRPLRLARGAGGCRCTPLPQGRVACQARATLPSARGAHRGHGFAQKSAARWFGPLVACRARSVAGAARTRRPERSPRAPASAHLRTARPPKWTHGRARSKPPRTAPRASTRKLNER